MRRIFVVGVMSLFIACSKTPEQAPAPLPSPTPSAPKISIASVTPVSGRIGDTIIINGAGFGSDRLTVYVTIGSSAKFNPLNVSDNKMSVVIPRDARTGSLTATFVINQTSVAGGNFVVNLPAPLTVTAFMPTVGRVGDTLTIIGTGFGTDTNRILVKLEEVTTLKPFKVSDKSLSFIVPSLAVDRPAIYFSVINEADSVKVNWPVQILQPNPIITGFSPKTAKNGDTLKVQGTYLFRGYQQYFYIDYGDGIKQIQTVFDGNPNQLQFVVNAPQLLRKLPFRIWLLDTPSSIASYSAFTKDSLTTLPR
jgi:hypothetical protein